MRAKEFIVETTSQSQILNLIAKDLAAEILAVYNKPYKENSFATFIAGPQGDFGSMLRIYGIPAKTFSLPKVNDPEINQMLKKLVFRTTDDRTRNVTGEYYRGTETDTILLYMKTLQTITKEYASDMETQLANTIVHELQHALDNLKGGEKAVSPKASGAAKGYDEYLRIPHEVNARMQEALQEISQWVALMRAKPDVVPSSKDVIEMIQHTFKNAQLTNLYAKDQKEYKKLLSRAYKFFDAELKSPKTVTPRNILARALSWITGGATHEINEVAQADLDQWNPERFQTQQEADPVGEISDKQSFSSRLPSCLDMPIKLPGSSIKLPYKNRGVVEFVQRALQHNQKVNPRFDQSYIYLTVDQRIVEGSKTHRRGGAHFDGMQGERYQKKLPMDQNYIVSDYNPTHLFNQPFDARGLSTKHHNWFHELEKQVDKSRTFIPDPYVIYFVSGYHMHESPIAPETKLRTFMRISVGYKPGGLPGETPNPLLPTPRLNRDREIPGNLQKADLKKGAAPDPTQTLGPQELDEYKADNDIEGQGLGTTGYNANVKYRGLRVLMKPSTFHKLAYPLEMATSVDYIKDHMKAGGALGSPYLLVAIPEEWFTGDFSPHAKVIGHEGRNRMAAISELEGDAPCEVHLFPYGELRARHMTPEIIKRLQDSMINQEGNRIIFAKGSGTLFELMA